MSSPCEDEKSESDDSKISWRKFKYSLADGESEENDVGTISPISNLLTSPTSTTATSQRASKRNPLTQTQAEGQSETKRIKIGKAPSSSSSDLEMETDEESFTEEEGFVREGDDTILENPNVPDESADDYIEDEPTEEDAEDEETPRPRPKYTFVAVPCGRPQDYEKDLYEPQRPNSRKPKPNTGRVEYDRADDLKMLKIIGASKWHAYVNGKIIYKEMTKYETAFPDRTFESLSNRFRKTISKKLKDTYGLSKDELKLYAVGAEKKNRGSNVPTSVFNPDFQNYKLR